MADKKTVKGRILWVDDEVDLLLPHRLVLEQRGYEVDTLPNGDDALSQLRRQSYDLILLDQEMPGRTGTEMLREIRGVDSRIAVVMVTKSEEENTLREAIARRADEYIVKPTSPRQVASVVARILEGPGLRHEEMARDFVRAFSELRARIDDARSWRDWTDLYSDLIDWDLELNAAEETGLLDSLNTLSGDVRREFTNFVVKNYVSWVSKGQVDRPSLSIDVIPQFFVPLLARGEPAVLIITSRSSPTSMSRSFPVPHRTRATRSSVGSSPTNWSSSVPAGRRPGTTLVLTRSRTSCSPTR
jgi:CheY-like chemotaxis protein